MVVYKTTALSVKVIITIAQVDPLWVSAVTFVVVVW